MGEDFKCQSALVGGLVPSTFLSACGATIFPKRGISHIILKVFFYLSSLHSNWNAFQGGFFLTSKQIPFSEH